MIEVVVLILCLISATLAGIYFVKYYTDKSIKKDKYTDA